MVLKVEVELNEKQLKEILKKFLLENPQILKEIVDELENSLFLKHLQEAEKSPSVDRKEIEKLLE